MLESDVRHLSQSLAPESFDSPYRASKVEMLSAADYYAELT